MSFSGQLYKDKIWISDINSIIELLWSVRGKGIFDRRFPAPMKCYSFAFLCFLGSALSRRLWCKAGMESLEWAVVVLSLTHHQNMFCLIGPRSHLINVNWTLFLSTTAMATTTNMARIPCLFFEGSLWILRLSLWNFLSIFTDLCFTY